MGNLYALGEDLIGIFAEDGSRGVVTHLPAMAKGGGWEQHVCILLLYFCQFYYLFHFPYHWLYIFILFLG